MKAMQAPTEDQKVLPDTDTDFDVNTSTAVNTYPGVDTVTDANGEHPNAWNFPASDSAGDNTLQDFIIANIKSITEKSESGNVNTTVSVGENFVKLGHFGIHTETPSVLAAVI